MARLNARRRMEARLKVARIEYAKARNPSTVASEGPMRSSHKTALLATQRFHAPKPLNWEGRGSATRKGKKLWSKV